MTPSDLQKFLDEHCDVITSFMDYEPFCESEEELATTLGYWFDKPDWNDGSQRFVHLGIDGTGSQFAAWVRPDAKETPVVFFGSEGGRGVLTRSLEAWVKVLAFAPGIDEYPDDDAPACLDLEMNWMKEEEDVDDEIAAYREVVESKFGNVEPFDDLTAGLDDLNKAFKAWIEKILG